MHKKSYRSKKTMRGDRYVPVGYDEWLKIFAKELNNKIRHSEFLSPDAFWGFINEMKNDYNYMLEDEQLRQRDRSRKSQLRGNHNA